MTCFSRLGAGAGYRFVSGVDKFGLAASDVGGSAIIMTFEFGKF